MFERFYPDEDMPSVYDISFETLSKNGIRAVIFDIDNTLVLHDAPADNRAKALFGTLKGLGIKACLLSNNKEKRVASFAAEAGVSLYISKGGKPGRKGYEKAVRLAGVSKEQAVFVGDQLFTDIYGARRAGIYSILVKPMNRRESIHIVLKRYLEGIVLFFYQRKKKMQEVQTPREGKE